MPAVIDCQQLLLLSSTGTTAITVVLIIIRGDEAGKIHIMTCYGYKRSHSCLILQTFSNEITISVPMVIKCTNVVGTHLSLYETVYYHVKVLERVSPSIHAQLDMMLQAGNYCTCHIMSAGMTTISWQRFSLKL
jgi:hypothetical protein